MFESMSIKKLQNLPYLELCDNLMAIIPVTLILKKKDQQIIIKHAKPSMQTVKDILTLNIHMASLVIFHAILVVC